MMGGAGHMQDMINKIKQNRDLKTSRRKTRDRFNKLKSSENSEQLKFKKVSQQELDSINHKNRKLAKKERIQKNILTLLIFIPIFVWIIYLLKKALYITFK